MFFKQPKFWRSDKGAKTLSAFFLSPIARIYDFETQRRLKRTNPFRSSLPVICIGNITLGGIGKTPFALALSELFSKEGYTSHFLSRGYGGTDKGPLKIDNKTHDAVQVGDEALLLAQAGPSWIARNRVAGAQSIAAGIADPARSLIIMDDGLQNPTLYKDVSIVLIDATSPFGNGLVFPAGPLRELPRTAKRRADIFVFVKQDKRHHIPDTLISFAGETPWFECWTQSTSSPPPSSSRGVIAFCGIGHPQKFYDTCKNAGLTLIETISFPDHHLYSNKDIDQLLSKAQRQNADLITTRKDFVKLKKEYQDNVNVLDIAIKINDPEQFLGTVKRLARLGRLSNED